MKVCVLGSGSGGNCTFVEAAGFKFLIDAARLPQRYIKESLKEIGADISEIRAVLSTHVHGDHVDGGVTFPLCRKHDIPLYIHRESRDDLFRRSDKFIELDRAGLVRGFDDEPFQLAENMVVKSFHVVHGNGWNRDCVGRPVGFRVSAIEGLDEKILAHATDLGSVEPHVTEAFTGADAIVLESNYDEEMERGSSRPGFLVKWVMGPRGHLSNDQAARMLSEALRAAGGRTRHVCLAHISRDCNTPEIALETTARVLEKDGAPDVNLHTALQRTVGEVIEI